MGKREIKAVLSTLKYDQCYLDQIIEAVSPAKVYQFDPEDEDGIRSVIQKVDVAFLNTDLNDTILEGENLRWIHCGHSGLTLSARPEVFQRNIILTGAAGRSAPALAEHVFFFILCLTYDVYHLHRAQQEHNWTRFEEKYANAKGLSGKTIGIIGLGNTGIQVARRAKAFDMNVLAYSRSVRKEVPRYVDEYYAADEGDSMDALLENSDYIVLCCHLSNQTYHLIGKEQFQKMKRSTYLINMSRGAVVDEKELYRVLKNDEIAGAGCDVFETEPLPAESPLWDLPNMIITPHRTPRVPDIYRNMVDILLKNIERYRNNEAMINQLSERDIFSIVS